MEPVSSQAPPLPIKSAVNCFLVLYKFSKSTISTSPLFDGFNFFAKLTTLLSKKYSPVIAKSEKNFLVFLY